jgi:hypothetical protein
MERAVLDLVPQSPRNILASDVARHLFGPEPTQAQLRSMRRAFRSLADKGLVVTRLEPGPTWVRDVFATARPGGSGYRKVDRGGHRLGSAVMNVLSRPIDDGPQRPIDGPGGG